ncbi:MAG: hypothetical protein NWF06_06760 [Candidatus Bathyarchaeota archaeon]|nr:hypothetical protein [Candidatus Bathyarchaeum sp.]
MRTSKSRSKRMLNAFVVLARNTTWKCGRIERLVINYLQLQLKQYGCTQASVKEILRHLKLKKSQKRQLFEAMERLEKRGIIQIVSMPFVAPEQQEVYAISRQGGV